MIGVKIHIEGVDGSIWRIAGDGSYSSPVQLEEGAVGDLYDAPVRTSYQSLAGIAGSRYQGMRYEGREIVLRLTSHDQSDRENWARVDSDLRRAFAYDRASYIVVSTEMSGERRLGVRLAEEPQYQGDLLPQYQGVARWQFALTAEDPFWYGETLKDEFEFDGLNFFGGGVTVYNRGDVATWPQWVLTAPAKFALPDIDLTLLAPPQDQLWLPFQPLGHEVVVNTDPSAEMIVDERRTLLWAQMNGQMFQHPIPAHQSPVELPVSVDPMPLIPFVIPDAWRRWIAKEIDRWVKTLGLQDTFALTPDDLANKIKQIINNMTPEFIAMVGGDIVTEIVPSMIADAIRDAYGSVGNMAGAVAQVRVPQRWTRPWGLD